MYFIMYSYIITVNNKMPSLVIIRVVKVAGIAEKKIHNSLKNIICRNLLMSVLLQWKYNMIGKFFNLCVLKVQQKMRVGELKCCFRLTLAI